MSEADHVLLNCVGLMSVGNNSMPFLHDLDVFPEGKEMTPFRQETI